MKLRNTIGVYDSSAVRNSSRLPMRITLRSDDDVSAGKLNYKWKCTLHIHWQFRNNRMYWNTYFGFLNKRFGKNEENEWLTNVNMHEATWTG